jgi:EAL domain-containing protein (putative c-di-GMP-specific phosphodiesterase class I)
MRDQVVHDLQLDTAIRLAVERREFVPFFQPLVEVATGRLAGFEMLMRWRHPARGILLPAEFLGALQANGLAVPVGQQLVREVCRQLRTWKDEGLGDGTLWANVNFSSRELQQDALAARLVDVLAAHGLAPHNLVVEITESTIIEDFDRMAGIVTGLRQAGIRVVMDDFGTGYSSLACLHRLPLNGIKLDRSFADGARNSQAVASAVTGLARDLGLTVTAEGIETVDQLERMRKLGCHFAQGFLFARALDPAAAGAALSLGGSAVAAATGR